MHEPIWPESEGRGGEQEGGWRGNKSRRDSGVRGMGGVILIDGGEGFNNVRTPPPRGWGCNIYNFTRRHRCTPLPPSNAQPYLSSCPPIIHLLPSNILWFSCSIIFRGKIEFWRTRCVKWEEKDQSRGVIRDIDTIVIKIILFPDEAMNHCLGGVISFIKEWCRENARTLFFFSYKCTITRKLAPSREISIFLDLLLKYP